MNSFFTTLACFFGLHDWGPWRPAKLDPKYEVSVCHECPKYRVRERRLMRGPKPA